MRKTVREAASIALGLLLFPVALAAAFALFVGVPGLIAALQGWAALQLAETGGWGRAAAVALFALPLLAALLGALGLAAEPAREERIRARLARWWPRR